MLDKESSSEAGFESRAEWIFEETLDFGGYNISMTLREAQNLDRTMFMAFLNSSDL